eukprot:SAG22_NODE_498_length_9728_cov_12.354346_1_plen_1377_part_00
MDFEEAFEACYEEGLDLDDLDDLDAMQEALLVHFEVIEVPTAHSTTVTVGNLGGGPTAKAAEAGTPAPKNERTEQEQEYDSYLEIIDQLGLEEAHEMCTEEGVLPSENTLLAAKEALLAHFCGPAHAAVRAAQAEMAAEETNTDAKADNEHGLQMGHVHHASTTEIKKREERIKLTHTSRWKAVGGLMTGGLSKAKQAKNLTEWRKDKRKEEEAKMKLRVQTLFDEIDDDGSGELDREEVGQLLGKLSGTRCTPDELDAAMAELDEDDDGDVTFKEFLQWWNAIRADRAVSPWAVIINMRNRELQEEEELRTLFESIDTDGGGTIDADELLKLTSDLGLALTHVEIQEAMRDIDDDDSGEIDFEEFYDWYRLHKKEKFGLATEIQGGLKRSMLLKGAKNSMFAALDGEKSTAHVKEMFERLDGDGSGALGYAEFYELNDGLHLNLTHVEIRKAMKEMDTDGDGEIDLKEFEDWWLSTNAGASGKLRSKFKLAGYLANVSGSVLTATQMTDQDEDSLVEAEMYLQDLLSSSFNRTIQMEGMSLGIFGRRSYVRRACAWILSNSMTEWFLVLCILVNLASIVAADVTVDTGFLGLQFDLKILNDGINIIFTIEAVLRIIAQSFTGGRHAYMGSRWNVFDFMIIVAVWVLWIAGWLLDLPASVTHDSNIISVLRSFRALRFFKHIRQMLMALNESIPMMTVIVYGLIILFIVFGVLFHALFNGALTHACGEATVKDCPLCGPLQDHCPEALGCTAQDLQCYVLPRTVPALSREDHTDKFGFDNAAMTTMTMFSMVTLDDWHQYSNAFRASHSVHSKTTAAVGVFIIVVALMAVNFFLSAIAFSYIKVRSESRKAEIQRAAEESMAINMLQTDDMFTAPIEEEVPADQGCCTPVKALVRHPHFEMTVMVVVMLNIVLMAADHHPKSVEFVEAVETAEIFFYVFYLAEFILKVTAMGVRGYWKIGLNRLDFVIVMAATMTYLSILFDNILPDMKDIMVFRIMRMTRLLRAVRVAKLIMRSDQIRRMMTRAFSGRAAIASLVFLIAFFLGVAAIIANVIFADCGNVTVAGATFDHDDNVIAESGSGSGDFVVDHWRDHHPARPNFEGFGSSFIANFVILSTDSWTALAFDYMECSAWAAPYFVIVVIATYFILSNLFVAVFFESFELNDDEKREQQIQEYLEDARENGGGLNVLDVKSRLESVNDFLGTTRSRISSGGHVSFNAFIGAISMTEKSARTALKFVPGAEKLVVRPANCFIALFRSKKKTKRPDDLISVQNPSFGGTAHSEMGMISVQNPSYNSVDSEAEEQEEQEEPWEMSAFGKKCAALLNNFVFQWAVIAACLVNALTIGIDEWRLESVEFETVKIGAELLQLIPVRQRSSL